MNIPQTVDKEFVIKLLHNRIDNLDIGAVKDDVVRFISDSKELDIWSKDFFIC